jgi:hypothetical protein
VLRLFPDEVGIFIAPSKVLLVKTRRGLKPDCVAEQSIRVEAGAAGDWDAALAVLRGELEQTAWHTARARVVVANHWVRYEVLPWSVELAKESERLAHARYLLSATYGDIVEQWTVALSEAAPGAPRLVSAIPSALLADLTNAVTAHGLKLLSLQPQLVVAYNLWRHRFPRPAAWFASIDDSSLVAMHMSNGHCDRVRSVRISDDWVVELQRIQTMGRLAQGRPAEGPVFVDAPLCVRQLAGSDNASVEWLKNEARPQDTLGRLAALREAHA